MIKNNFIYLCIRKGCVFMSYSSVDNLMKSGIINFDPEAYVRNGASVYVPQDNETLPFDKPLYPLSFYSSFGAPPYASGEPNGDAFISRTPRETPPPWKGILAGFLLTGLAIFAGTKLFHKKPVVEEVKPKGFFIKCKDKIKSWFKPKNEVKKVEKTEKTVTETVKETAKDVVKDKKGFFKKLPKWAKIGGGALGGVFGLYLIYKAFAPHRHYAAAPEPEEYYPEPMINR